MEIAQINKHGKIPISLLLLENSLHILYDREICIFRYPYLLDTTLSQDSGIPLPDWVLLSHSNKYELSPELMLIFKKNVSKDNKSKMHAIIGKLAEVILITKEIFKAKFKSPKTIKETMKEYTIKLAKIEEECSRRCIRDIKELAKVKDSFGGISTSKVIPNEKSKESCFPKIKIPEEQENIESSKEMISPTKEYDIFPTKVSTPSKKKVAYPIIKSSASGFASPNGLRQTTPGKNIGFSEAHFENSASIAPTSAEYGSTLYRKPATEERIAANSLSLQKSQKACTNYEEVKLTSLKCTKSSYIVTKIAPSEKKATSDAHWVNTCVICEKKFVFKKYLVLPCNHQIHSKCMALYSFTVISK